MFLMVKIIYEFEDVKDFESYIFGNLPKSTLFNKKEVQEKVEETFRIIPKMILDRMEEDGWSFVFTNTRNLEKEYNFNFQIYGLTDFSNKQILVYANAKAIRYSIPHEIGHYVDSVMRYISNKSHWEFLFELEKSDAVKIHFEDYFVLFRTPEEFFAECFGAYLLMSKEEKEMLKTKKLLQKSMDVIERILRVFPYVKRKESIMPDLSIMQLETNFW